MHQIFSNGNNFNKNLFGAKPYTCTSLYDNRDMPQYVVILIPILGITSAGTRIFGGSPNRYLIIIANYVKFMRP